MAHLLVTAELTYRASCDTLFVSQYLRDTMSVMKVVMMKYFPQGIATGDSFCNRDNERAAMRLSIESHEHTVLIAPRRYGKSSLVSQVLSEISSPGVCIDLFFVLSQAEIVRSLSEGLAKVMSALLPKTKGAAQKVIDSIAALNPKFSLKWLGAGVEITTSQNNEKTITELLTALDQAAQKAGKSCVLVFDEFQQIGELKENHAVEAAIRHAAERSVNVSYIFSGSKRHLLDEMFSDKSRPLYHLCDLMSIRRIDESAYLKFLDKMAKKKWKKGLEVEVMSEILYLTERHPYYVNSLCRRLWRLDKQPTLLDVRQGWDNYVEQQGVWIMNDLSRLTLNRRKVASALAYEPTKEVQGGAFTSKLGLGSSAVRRALSDLSKLDVIHQDERGLYHVLDPAVSYFIRKKSIAHDSF